MDAALAGPGTAVLGSLGVSTSVHPRVVLGDGWGWDGVPGGNRDPCLQDFNSRGRDGNVHSCWEPSSRPD